MEAQRPLPKTTVNLGPSQGTTPDPHQPTFHPPKELIKPRPLKRTLQRQSQCTTPDTSTHPTLTYKPQPGEDANGDLAGGVQGRSCSSQATVSQSYEDFDDNIAGTKPIGSFFDRVDAKMKRLIKMGVFQRTPQSTRFGNGICKMLEKIHLTPEEKKQFFQEACDRAAAYDVHKYLMGLWFESGEPQENRSVGTSLGRNGAATSVGASGASRASSATATATADGVPRARLHPEDGGRANGNEGEIWATGVQRFLPGATGDFVPSPGPSQITTQQPQKCTTLSPLKPTIRRRAQIVKPRPLKRTLLQQSQSTAPDASAHPALTRSPQPGEDTNTDVAGGVQGCSYSTQACGSLSYESSSSNTTGSSYGQTSGDLFEKINEMMKQLIKVNTIRSMPQNPRSVSIMLEKLKLNPEEENMYMQEAYRRARSYGIYKFLMSQWFKPAKHKENGNDAESLGTCLGHGSGAASFGAGENATSDGVPRARLLPGGTNGDLAGGVQGGSRSGPANKSLNYEGPGSNSASAMERRVLFKRINEKLKRLNEAATYESSTCPFDCIVKLLEKVQLDHEEKVQYMEEAHKRAVTYGVYKYLMSQWFKPAEHQEKGDVLRRVQHFLDALQNLQLFSEEKQHDMEAFGITPGHGEAVASVGAGENAAEGTIYEDATPVGVPKTRLPPAESVEENGGKGETPAMEAQRPLPKTTVNLGPSQGTIQQSSECATLSPLKPTIRRRAHIIKPRPLKRTHLRQSQYTTPDPSVHPALAHGPQRGDNASGELAGGVYSGFCHIQASASQSYEGFGGNTIGAMPIGGNSQHVNAMKRWTEVEAQTPRISDDMTKFIEMLHLSRENEDAQRRAGADRFMFSNYTTGQWFKQPQPWELGNYPVLLGTSLGHGGGAASFGAGEDATSESFIWSRDVPGTSAHGRLYDSRIFSSNHGDPHALTFLPQDDSSFLRNFQFM